MEIVGIFFVQRNMAGQQCVEALLVSHITAFCTGLHQRCGKNSPVSMLPSLAVCKIIRLLRLPNHIFEKSDKERVAYWRIGDFVVQAVLCLHVTCMWTLKIAMASACLLRDYSEKEEYLDECLTQQWYESLFALSENKACYMHKLSIHGGRATGDYFPIPRNSNMFYMVFKTINGRYCTTMNVSNNTHNDLTVIYTVEKCPFYIQPKRLLLCEAKYTEVHSFCSLMESIPNPRDVNVYQKVKWLKNQSKMVDWLCGRASINFIRKDSEKLHKYSYDSIFMALQYVCKEGSIFKGKSIPVGLEELKEKAQVFVIPKD